MVGRPRFLYLDEPTTGLDPRGRLELWGMIRGLVAGGTTVLLTTQYLEEADKLASRGAALRSAPEWSSTATTSGALRAA